MHSSFPYRLASAIDCEGDHLLILSEIMKLFKHHINLSEEVNLCIGIHVMIFDNSLIQYQISNGTPRVIMELFEDDTSNGTIYPIVIFPTENGTEVSTIILISY
jgi:hypothetical protein